MKILLDPVLTSDPSKCSTYIQFRTLVLYILERRGDVWFYWRLPKWLTPEQREWLPQHPHIKYLEIEHHRTDRVQEYMTPSQDLHEHVKFFGSLWDYDVLITVRTPLVPLMRMWMNSPRLHHRTWMKRVWLIEEMPLMAFKGTVPVMNEPVQDHQALLGYLAADKVWMLSYHEHLGIRAAAQRYVGASQQRAINCKLESVVTTQFTDFKLKSKEFFTKPKPFGVAFVGRMEKTQAQLEEVNDLMLKHWVKKGESIKLIACTPSKTIKVFDQEHVECGSYPREEFWRIMAEEVHVVLSLGLEMGFSLSLLEPMMLGVPAVVLKRPYVLPLLGPDYPFYVNGPAEAGGMIEWMYQNYPTAYQKFMEYQSKWLVPTYKQRFVDDWLYPKINTAITEVQNDIRTRMLEHPEKAQNAIVQLIAQKVEGRKSFVFGDVIKELGATGELQHLANKIDPEWVDDKSLPWLPTWNEHRLILQNLLGWEDAGIEVGHLRRST
jgi:hypothetical protein